MSSDFVQCTCSPMMLMSNFRINVFQLAWRFPIFCDLCQPIVIHSVYIISPRSSPDPDPSYDIPNLAHVVHSIPQMDTDAQMH